MKQPYYQLDFSALLCKFQIKVNDIEILSLNLDGQASTDIPINAAIFGSGKQEIEVRGYPLEGTTVLNHEAYIRYKIVEQDVENDKFSIINSSEKYQTPQAKQGEPFIIHKTTFNAEVPYQIENWGGLQKLTNLKSDLYTPLYNAYNHLIENSKRSNHEALFSAIRTIETRNAKTMYLGHDDLQARVKDISDDLNNGFDVMDLENKCKVEYAGDGKLARLVRSDGNSALAFSNSKTNEQLILDIWFCLPHGKTSFSVF